MLAGTPIALMNVADGIRLTIKIGVSFGAFSPVACWAGGPFVLMEVCSRRVVGFT